MSSPPKSGYNYGEEDTELRKGPWTLDEDTLLTHYITCHGEGRWNLLAKCSGLKRTGKSCRLRWLNYLKPDVKRGSLTPEEQLVILELHSKWGNRWSKIAQHLPGRTDNEIKNYWRTRVQKQARRLKIDANSTRFRDAIRCYWVPRLLQKMEESASSSSSTMTIYQRSSTLPLEQDPQAASPPPPLPQECLIINDTMQSFSHHEKNSSSDNFSSSSISTADSMSISQLPEILEYPHVFSNISHNPFLKGCYYMENSSSDLEAFNLSAPGALDNSVFDCHKMESNWVNNDVADSLWNMDELWQIRKLQEMGI